MIWAFQFRPTCSSIRLVVGNKRLIIIILVHCHKSPPIQRFDFFSRTLKFILTFKERDTTHRRDRYKHKYIMTNHNQHTIIYLPFLIKKIQKVLKETTKTI